MGQAPVLLFFGVKVNLDPRAKAWNRVWRVAKLLSGHINARRCTVRYSPLLYWSG